MGYDEEETSTEEQSFKLLDDDENFDDGIEDPLDGEIADFGSDEEELGESY